MAELLQRLELLLDKGEVPKPETLNPEPYNALNTFSTRARCLNPKPCFLLPTNSGRIGGATASVSGRSGGAADG